MSKIKLDYNQSIFKTLYYYDSNSNSGLRYLKDNNSTGKNKRFKNDSVGCLHITQKSKVWRVKIDKQSYIISRIIWYLHYGNIDKNKVIDHIDGNSLNNKIENLRLVSQEINNKNHKKQINNTTGITGVLFERIPYQRWKAIWNEDLKQKSKSFSIIKYGDSAFKLACDYRVNKIKNLKEYTDRHGN